MLEEFFGDLRYGARMLRKNPGFTAVAVLTLALGIGANTAVFTLVDNLILRPIAARDSGQLVSLYSHDSAKPAGDYRSFSYPNFADLRAHSDLFDDILAMQPNQVGVTEGEFTRRVFALDVSTNYFSVFGVNLIRGRSFSPEEERQAAPVVIISQRWWQQQGSDPEIIGRGLKINGRLFTIIGMAPLGFTGTMPIFVPDLYLPLSFPLAGANQMGASIMERSSQGLFLVGRLKHGFNLLDANSRLRVMSDQLAKAYPDANRSQVITVAPMPRLSISISPLGEHGTLGVLSLLLLAMSCAVLLIASLNLANMLLARGAARAREIAVRIAVGASGSRILRQLLTEGLLLSLLGTVTGLFLAFWAMHWFIGSLNNVAPTPATFNGRPDWRVLSATAGFSILATLCFALIPSWKLTRLDVNSDLKGNSSGAARSKRGGLFALGNLFVLCQIALSLALLVAAGLFGRDALKAMSLNAGFRTNLGFYVETDGGLVDYGAQKMRQSVSELLERIRTLPGVQSASVAATIPFGNLTLGEGVQRAGSPIPAPLDAVSPALGQVIGADYNVIGNDYFRTLGVALLQGRDFSRAECDNTNEPKVAVLSAALAQKLWPGESPLGRRVQLTRSGAPSGGVGRVLGSGARSGETMEVVGIVPSGKAHLVDPNEGAAIFVPFAQDPRLEVLLHVQPSPGGNADALLQTTLAEIHRFDPNLPVLSAKSLRAHVRSSLEISIMRSGATLFATLGAAALLLSVLGVYGVMAYSVARRTRELGIRMALGADRASVLRLFLSEGVKLAALGLLIGSVLGLALAKSMAGFLFETKAFDPLIFFTAQLFLASAVVLACYVPARRAARTDPLEALRCE
ncbi:MAG: ABC transporter permease [Limisphaerales bacterium]